MVAFDVFSWLTTPISGSSTHHISMGTAWHGRLMTFAWGLVAPASIFVARYFKIVPGQKWPEFLDNPFWFKNHRRLGYAIGVITLLALLVGIAGSGALVAPWNSLHASLGWLVIVCMAVQIFGSRLRGTHGGPVDPFTRKRKPPEQWPGDHYDMSRRRVVYEFTHKLLGYVVVALAVLVLYLGLRNADAPRWMWLGLTAWWLLCIGATLLLQYRVGCIDTYQAIWGLDRSLPGYRRSPVGIAIRRFSEADASAAPWQRSANDRKREDR